MSSYPVKFRNMSITTLYEVTAFANMLLKTCPFRLGTAIAPDTSEYARTRAPSVRKYDHCVLNCFPVEHEVGVVPVGDEILWRKMGAWRR